MGDNLLQPNLKRVFLCMTRLSQTLLEQQVLTLNGRSCLTLRVCLTGSAFIITV